MMLTIQEAKDIYRVCKDAPGKLTANNALNSCRKYLQQVGQKVDMSVAAPSFHWRAYLGGHDQAEAIFASAGITDFFAEAFPEKDPNA